MNVAGADAFIDWDLAGRTVSNLVRPGPQIGRAELTDAVDALRRHARLARPHVAEVTGITAPESTGDVLVVDRPSWARANITGFRAMLGPVVGEVVARRHATPNPLVSAVGSRVTGAEMGTLLAYLSTKVLGQYDPFGADDGPGRLLLVVPNIIATERELGVHPDDFRLWVCLHEETHRVQFTATSWLAEHLLTQIRSLVGDLLADPSAMAERLVRALRDLPDLLRGQRDPDQATERAPQEGAPEGTPHEGMPREGTPHEGTPRAQAVPEARSLLDLVQTPEQRQRLARLTAVMSLLEGHADVVMDEVGPKVVPTVREIRERFTQRRNNQSLPDQLLRRLLGLDAKARQYRDGARFVRQVVADVGMSGFNAVWAGPQNLPEPEEIMDPSRWVRRVGG